MKVKSILIYAWAIILPISIYVSFKTPVKYKLWSWFGYNFGFADLASNMPIKLSFCILLVATLFSAAKIKYEETGDFSDVVRIIKKKRIKSLTTNKTIKV